MDGSMDAKQEGELTKLYADLAQTEVTLNIILQAVTYSGEVCEESAKPETDGFHIGGILSKLKSIAESVQRVERKAVDIVEAIKTLV